MKIKIKNDFFNIYKRIKLIDKNFEIVYDTEIKKYYILKNKNIVITLNYECLTEQCLEYVKKHLRKSNKEILKEIEENNLKIENKIKENIKVSAVEKAEKVLRRT